jgi:hypothetical protein
VLPIETLVVAVVSMAPIVISSAVAAFPEASVEFGVAVMTMVFVITLLCETRQRSEQKNGREENASPWHSDFLSSAAWYASRGNGLSRSKYAATVAYNLETAFNSAGDV